MKPEVFEKIVNDRTTQRLAVSREKRKGYATDSDCLENFKVMAMLCKVHHVDVTKPEGVAQFWIIHKLQRRSNMMAKGLTKASDESLNDTDIDMLNYLDLLRAIEIEKAANT